jgi:hypothetical protein
MMGPGNSFIIRGREKRDALHRVLTEVTGKVAIENLLLVMITRIIWLVRSWGIGRDRGIMVDINTNKSANHRSGVKFIAVVMQEGEKQRLLAVRPRHRKGNSLRLEAGHSGPWNWGQTLVAAMESRQECFVETRYSNLGMYWANALGHSRNAVGVGQEPMGLSAGAAY